MIKSEQKGYGLCAQAHISQDQFIIEYVGQVVCSQTQTSHNKQQQPYLIKLVDGYHVDATEQGNWSRFINHSDTPSCRVERWTVGGTLRIGIFAGRSIAPREQLTIDYNTWTPNSAFSYDACGKLVNAVPMQALPGITQRCADNTSPLLALFKVHIRGAYWRPSITRMPEAAQCPNRWKSILGIAST